MSKNFQSQRQIAKQRGVALVTVLLVFAIATVIASEIMTRRAIDMKRSEGMLDRTQAYYYALGAEELAQVALKRDYDEDKDNGDFTEHLKESWAASVSRLAIDDLGSVSVVVTDLERFYNLNNLIDWSTGDVDVTEVARFRQLLNILDLPLELADNLRDWLDSDQQEEGYRSEDGAYLSENIPYRAANAPMSHISELRLVRGFDASVIEALSPYITVINAQKKTKINVNTASTEVLTTLSKQGGVMSLSDAERIVSARESDHFLSVTEFKDHPSARNIVNPSEEGDVMSSYFELAIVAEYSDHLSYLTSVIYRDGNGDTQVIHRTESNNIAKFINDD